MPFHPVEADFTYRAVVFSFFSFHCSVFKLQRHVAPITPLNPDRIIFHHYKSSTAGCMLSSFRDRIQLAEYLPCLDLQFQYKLSKKGRELLLNCRVTPWLRALPLILLILSYFWHIPAKMVTSSERCQRNRTDSNVLPAYLFLPSIFLALVFLPSWSALSHYIEKKEHLNHQAVWELN